MSSSSQSSRVSTGNSVASAATTAASSSSTSSAVDKCSVEGILRDMTQSFANFQSARSSCTKDFSSINWNTFSFPTMTPSSTLPTTTASHQSSSSFLLWRPSLDFLKAINISNLGGRTATTGEASSNGIAAATTKSSSLDLYERMGNISSQILAEGRIISSVSQQLEDKVAQFVTETLQVTTTGVFLGAVVGAAVATGVMVGMMSMLATGVVGGESMAYLYRFWRPAKVTTPTTTTTTTTTKKEDHKDSPKQTAPSSQTALTTSVVTTGPLFILQANPTTATATTTTTTHDEDTAEKQCVSCLQHLEASLTQQDMVWEDVRRLTVYLVSGRCDAKTFRNTFQTYYSGGGGGGGGEQPLISILFVQQLEDPAAMLQIEAMASK